MLNLIGKPVDIAHPILGIITNKNVGFFLRHKHILVTSRVDGNWGRYAGVITTSSKPRKLASIPHVYGLSTDEISKLCDGDIVLIETNGMVNQIWDSDAPHNALLATEDCNCSCIMCPQPRKKDSEDKTHLNIRIIKLLDPKRTTSVGITGGEPTLLGEGLVKLIMECKKRLPHAPILLLTNGKRFEDISYVEKICAIGHDVTFGIPLYSDNDTEHDRIVGAKGSFYQTVEGITNLARYKQKIEIRNVLLKPNFKRLPQFAEYVYRNFPFVIHVAFMGMETTGLALKNLGKIWIDPMEYMVKLREAVLHLYRRELRVSIYNLPLCIIPKELWTFSRKSISTWKNIYINECEQCTVKEKCCGFFSTSGNHMSSGIKPI